MYTVTVKTETRPFGFEYVAYDRAGNWRTRAKVDVTNVLSGRALAEHLYHADEIVSVVEYNHSMYPGTETEILLREYNGDDKPELSETPGPWRMVKSAGGFLIMGANDRIVNVLTPNQEVNGQLMAQAWELREMVAKLQEELKTLKQQLQGVAWQVVNDAGETLKEIPSITES